MQLVMMNHMVQYSSDRLDASFSALSDATRRGVLHQLGRADASISDLAEKFEPRDPRRIKSWLLLGESLFYNDRSAAQSIVLGRVAGLYEKALRLSEIVYGSESAKVDGVLALMVSVELFRARGLPYGEQRKEHNRLSVSYMLRRLAILEHGGEVSVILSIHSELVRHFMEEDELDLDLAEQHARAALTLEEHYYQLALKSAPSPSPDWLAHCLGLVGQVLEKRGRGGEAQEYIDRALKVQCEYYFVNAFAFENKGDRKNALLFSEMARNFLKKGDKRQRELVAEYCRTNSGIDIVNIPPPPDLVPEVELAPAVDPNRGRASESAPYFSYGRVVDLEGEPLEGVEVTLSEYPDTYIGRVTTGESGEFRFPDELLYDSQYVLAADKAGYRYESRSFKRYCKACIFYLEKAKDSER